MLSYIFIHFNNLIHNNLFHLYQLYINMEIYMDPYNIYILHLNSIYNYYHKHYLH